MGRTFIDFWEISNRIYVIVKKKAFVIIIIKRRVIKKGEEVEIFRQSNWTEIYLKVMLW